MLTIGEPSPDLDPRHVFLDATRSDGPLRLGQDEGLPEPQGPRPRPPPVMVHPDRWRLDQLLSWEERRIALAEAATPALVEPRRSPALVDMLPSPKRAPRRSA